MTPESSRRWWNPSTKLVLFIAHQTLQSQEVQHTHSSSGVYFFSCSSFFPHRTLYKEYRRGCNSFSEPSHSKHAVHSKYSAVALSCCTSSPWMLQAGLCAVSGYIWQKLGSSIKQVIATVQTPLIHSRRECYILKQVLSFQMSPSMSPNVTFLDFFL